MNKCDKVPLNAVLYEKNTLEVYCSFCPLRFVTDIAKLWARDLFFDLWRRTENPRLIGRREYELSILSTLWNKEKLIAHFSMTPLLIQLVAFQRSKSKERSYVNEDSSAEDSQAVIELSCISYAFFMNY